MYYINHTDHSGLAWEQIRWGPCPGPQRPAKSIGTWPKETVAYRSRDLADLLRTRVKASFDAQSGCEKIAVGAARLPLILCLSMRSVLQQETAITLGDG